jgi:hypothetical protein
MLLALIAVLLLEQVVAFLAGYHMPAAVRGRTARAAS